jgi:hypothetical protein
LLGCFGRYITVYSQQVSALNLAHALHRTGKLGAKTRVAVVGGGAAGLTVSVAAARVGATVTLLEKLHAPMGVQRRSTKRYIHPHIYDWPAPGSEIDDAQLPILNWTARNADGLATLIEREWKKEVDRYQNNKQLVSHFEVREVSVEPTSSACRTVTWNAAGPHGGDFDIVILAVGFGRESDTDGLQHRYWEDDRLDKIDDEKKACLISGCGDGGLTDLMRLCIKEFRHDWIVGMFADDPKSREIGRHLLEPEERFRESGNSHDLSGHYQDLMWGTSRIS